MTDEMIVSLYWQRDESAIKQTEEKYGRYLTVIAKNILFCDEDAKECVNETYLKAWNSMPQQRPSVLSTYLGKIARLTAIDAYRFNHREKRIASEFSSSLDELSDCVFEAQTPESETDYNLLADAISKYLLTVSHLLRTAFVRRYYYSDSVKEIADGFGCSESKVKSMLHRARLGLAEYLRKEGFIL